MISKKLQNEVLYVSVLMQYWKYDQNMKRIPFMILMILTNFFYKLIKFDFQHFFVLFSKYMSFQDLH